MLCIDNNNCYVIDNNNDRGPCMTNEPQRHLRTIQWWTRTAGSPLTSTFRPDKQIELQSFSMRAVGMKNRRQTFIGKVTIRQFHCFSNTATLNQVYSVVAHI